MKPELEPPASAKLPVSHLGEIKRGRGSTAQANWAREAVEPQTSRDASGAQSTFPRGGPSPSVSRRRFAPKGVEFHARRAEHGAGLLALFNEPQFLERASTLGPLADENELNQWLDGIVAARKFETVAIMNAKLVAFGGLYVQGGLFDHCGFLTLGVCEHAQGRGVGSTLVAMLLGIAKLRANLRKVQLTVFTDNAPAIRLYRSFGFQFEGLHRFFSRRGDGYVDAYSMALIFDERRPAGEGAGGNEIVTRPRKNGAGRDPRFSHFTEA
jgi:L-phenylalanine/L-methionine N-acetyltransferase